MKNLKYIIYLLLFGICLNVKAIDECKPEEMKRLRELASNVDIKYSYELKTDVEDNTEEKYFVYKLSVINFSDDLVIVEDNERISKDVIESTSYLEGYNLTFNIYSYTDNLCTHTNLKTIKLNLPYYNDYYNTHKDECNNYPNFKYCKEMLDEQIDIDDEEIDKLFNEYKKEKNKEDFDKEKTKIIDYIKDNKILFISIGVSLIVIVTIIIIVIKKRKNRDI